MGSTPDTAKPAPTPVERPYALGYSRSERTRLGRMATAFETLRAVPVRVYATALFTLAFAVRVLYIFAMKVYAEPEISEVIRVAKSLATTGTFANPYLLPTGVTAHVAPGYTGLLGLIYYLFGTGTTGALVQAICCAVIAAAIYALFPILARTLGLPVLPAVAGAALGALLPIRLFFETKGSSEAAASALVLLVAVITTVRTWHIEDKRRLQPAALAGLAWGIAFLTLPAAAPVCLALLILGAASVRKYSVAAVTVLLVAAAVITPWTIRNYQQFGKLFFVRDNLGLELATSNTEHSVRSVTEGLSLSRWIHPSVDVEEAHRVARLGEIQYNRERMAEAIAWIRSHRSEFIERTGMRFLGFWFPRTDHWGLPKMAIFALITAAAFAGVVRLWAQNRTTALVIACIWVVYPAIYYLLLADIRYTYPIYWTFLFAAPFAFANARQHDAVLREHT